MNRSSDEVLQRARGHLRQAAIEGLEATRALLEIAIQTSGLAQMADSSWVGNLQRTLEDQIAEFRRTGSLRLPSPIAEPLAAAIDAEIARWEMRSRNDSDARLVLRAFLGLRELLWELGMRVAPEEKEEKTPRNAVKPRPSRPPRNRVQRFKLED